jgi:hypothetical protein
MTVFVEAFQKFCLLHPSPMLVPLESPRLCLGFVTVQNSFVKWWKFNELNDKHVTPQGDLTWTVNVVRLFTKTDRTF